MLVWLLRRGKLPWSKDLMTIYIYNKDDPGHYSKQLKQKLKIKE